MLRKACDDFVVSAPPEQRVFKVFRRPPTAM
ncbi:nitrogenase-stabilizing/protective protein NifW, partial [Paraburkholderia sp. BR14319]